jgi:hypothetical protein
MARKTTWVSHSDTWIFKEGQYAKISRRSNPREERADFRVLRVLAGNTVETDLKGFSSFGWQGPTIHWSGDYKLED